MENMESKKNLVNMSKIYGIIITSLMLLIFGSKFIGLIIENGIVSLKEIPKTFVDWYDNPTAFFFTYIIGYTIIWWKPLLGSIIIIIGCIMFFIFNPLNYIFLIIFLIPTFLVAYFHIRYVVKYKKMNEKINAT